MPRTLQPDRTGRQPSRQFYYDGMVFDARSTRLTLEGHKCAFGCEGRWPLPCREEWPVSRFAWCQSCREGA